MLGGLFLPKPFMIDRDGSTIVVWDKDNIQSDLTLIQQARSPGRSITRLATELDNITAVSMGAFNPVTPEFYFSAERAPTPPTGSRFATLFAGLPSGVSQIGAAYTPGAGSGSGVRTRVSADGRYVVHGALDKAPTPVGSLLVNDRLTGTETDLYRSFGAAEFPTPTEFDVDRAGTRVCLRVNDAAAVAADGPGRFWVASPATPGAATAVTPVADTNSTCRWASTGSRFAYLSSTGTAEKKSGSWTRPCRTSCRARGAAGRRPEHTVLCSGGALDGWRGGHRGGRDDALPSLRPRRSRHEPALRIDDGDGDRSRRRALAER